MIKEKWAQIFQRLKKAYQAEPKTYLILFFLVICGAFLRLYRLPETMMFQGDQGRDALVVANIFREKDLVFVGPVTSIGNMYLGPFYYYFMLPFLWLSYPSPIGPAVGVALVNTLAILLVYFLGRRMFGSRTALYAAFLTTFSRTLITYSRFSWNPNLSFIFTLLTLFFLHQALTKETKNWLWVGLLGGLLIQLHYVNLIILALIGLFWLWQIWQKRKDKKWFRKKNFWLYSFLAILLFTFTTIPLLLFDWKHNWRNLEAGRTIFKQEEGFIAKEKLSPSQVFKSYFYRLESRNRQIVTDLVFPNLQVSFWSSLFALTFILSLLFYLKKNKNTEKIVAYQIVTIGLVLSIVIITAYRHSVYDHYLLFVLPLVFFAYGLLFSYLPKDKLTKIIGILLIIIFLFANYQSHYFQTSQNKLKELQQNTDFILENLEEKENFAFALIDNNRDSLGEHYRYYLSTKTNRLLPIDQSASADALFVVDETKKANLNDDATFAIVVFRQKPEATLSALPTKDFQPKIYKFSKIKTEK